MQRAQPPSPSRPNQNQKPRLSEGQNQFPLILMQARLSRGWTQQEVADQLGTTAQTVSRWERGMAAPGPYHRGKLRDLFGLSLATLSGSGSFEARAESQAGPASGDEAGQAAEAEESSASSQTTIAEPELLPTSASVRAIETRANRSEQATVPGHPPLSVSHQPSRLWRIMVIGCAVLLLAVLLLANWPSLALLAARLSSTAQREPTSNRAIGTIAFLSSEQFQGNSAAGMNDELAIDLSALPAPATGTSYFAWMTGVSGSEAAWLPLGRLTWKPTPSPRPTPSGSSHASNSDLGTASLLYVAPQHENLLLSFSRFLITQEATSIPPQQPSSVWVGQASISAVPTPGDPNHYSLRDHLRHLLAADPQLAAVGINGGLVYWLARNSEQVAQAASGLEGDWQRHQFRDLRQRLIGMLLYLDGSSDVQADLPPGTPAPSPSPFTRVGLLTVSPAQEPPGYVLHTDIHLEGVRDALGATDSQRQEALQLRSAMNAVGFWLSNVRQDALQLIRMDNTQLAQSGALALLRDLTTQAQDAYAGPTGQTATNDAGGPSSSSSSSSSATAAGAGVKWIESQSQQLATFSWYRV